MKKIQAMSRAAGHVDKILLEKFPRWIHEGVTEQQIFDQLCEAIRAGGEYELSFDPIVAFGSGGAEPHHEPTNYALSPGDTILIDCGAIFDGWCSDCTRMFSFGEPSAKFLQKYGTLLAVHEATLPKFISGAECAALDMEVREDLAEDASFFIHTLGHGVGSEVHVSPRIGKDSLEILKPGDVVTCEPGLYFPGEFGIRIEDQLVIQEKESPEIITTCSRELAIIDSDGRVTYRR